MRVSGFQQRSTVVYLINLLVADILLLLALPFKILVDLGVASWNLRVFHCQASSVTIYISLYASIAFLAFIIIDRYLQVGLCLHHRGSFHWTLYPAAVHLEALHF